MEPLFYIYPLGFCREENKETKQGGDRVVERTVAGSSKTRRRKKPSHIKVHPHAFAFDVATMPFQIIT